MDQPFKSGYIGIIGKPNVGKSTLLNRLIGEKIAITSAKPQTTRNRIMGVLTRPTSQMVFIDTPGIHQPKDQLHQFMMNEINESIKDVDLFLFLLEPSQKSSDDDLLAFKYLEKCRKPVLIVFNKSDLTLQDGQNHPDAYPAVPEKYKQLHVSALSGAGCGELLDTIESLLREGPMFFPEDTLTDRSERFIIAELIREKAYVLFQQEVPYSVAVMTEEVKDRGNGMTYIKATIFVEKDSQKGILIGNDGQMLKKLGLEARKDIEKLMDSKVYLDLWVKVKKNWRQDPNALKQIGLEGE
jgi:GTPase